MFSGKLRNWTSQKWNMYMNHRQTNIKQLNLHNSVNLCDFYCVVYFCTDVTPCSRCINFLLILLHFWWWTGLPLDNEQFLYSHELSIFNTSDCICCCPPTYLGTWSKNVIFSNHFYICEIVLIMGGIVDTGKLIMDDLKYSHSYISMHYSRYN